MDIQLLARRFCEYSLHIRGYSPDTIKRYRQIIACYARRSGIISIGQVTEQSLRDFFLDGRVSRGWRPRTFISFYQSLTVFFRWCISNGMLADNPLRDVELPKVDRRLPQKLTKQDAMRLMEVVYNLPYALRYERYRNHAIFAMLLFAGLRRGELLRLKFADVDVVNLTIFVSQGKGARDRIIPMSFTLAETLKRYLVERQRLQKTCPEFFTSLLRNSPLSRIALKRLVNKIRQTSGIHFTAHRLRHSFATLMLEGGCDIYSLSRMMGHSDIKTTTIYLSASVEHLRSQVSKHPLNDLVRP
ncbi:MAG: tyrosine-type recombinase/integrase [Bacteroidetes bacterium]|nr:tyrosine-type recombinase/integrase [Bacteroidota bacterium]